MAAAAAVAVAAVVFVGWAWKVLDWVWVSPRKLEKSLRKQGFRGNSYRLFHGDQKEHSEMTRKATLKPINLSDEVVLRLRPFIHQTLHKYGKKSFIWIGPTPRVHIMDPELIKEILVKSSKFNKPKRNPLIKLFADGLANHDAELWAKHRKLLNPAFHIEKLKCMLPAMYLSCIEMVSKWEKMISEDGSCELDVWPFLHRLTKDVISHTAFGSSYEEGNIVFELQTEQAELVMKTLLSVYIPGWSYLPTKRNKRMKEIDRKTQSCLMNIINKKTKAMQAGEATADDLLGILLESNLKEQLGQGNKNVGMSIQEVMGECKQFYFAGQETTSGLLVWTMVLLSIHPDWQKRAREEILQEFGNEKPDFDHLNHLKIVTMILYEVLRLYPPIDTLFRRVDQETTLGDITLPGVQISIPLMVLHRDQNIWGDDAREFNPERFSEGVSKATKNQVVFFPFGWGPRICIGQNFAMLEAKLALAVILQRFSFELSPSYTHAPINVLTVQPQHGANLILHKL
nr:cytochrome P450 [Panax notoginseng]